MKEGKTSPAFKTNTLILKTESGATCGLYSGVPATKTYEAIIHTAKHFASQVQISFRDEARHGKAFEGLLARYFK